MIAPHVPPSVIDWARIMRAAELQTEAVAARVVSLLESAGPLVEHVTPGADRAIVVVALAAPEHHEPRWTGTASVFRGCVSLELHGLGEADVAMVLRALRAGAGYHPENPEACRCGSTDTSFGPNPYMADIHDDHTPVWMCDECWYQAAMDI